LRAFIRDVFASDGVATDHAERVADGLFKADRRGVDSHGVARLERYMKTFEGSEFSPDLETRGDDCVRRRRRRAGTARGIHCDERGVRVPSTASK
jgi:LDH2 family malate/lactate/ureidoglycolate dehydrogenase